MHKSFAASACVRINSVAPGWIRTTAADALVDRIAAHEGEGEAAARQSIMGRPEEVAELVAFLSCQ